MPYITNPADLPAVVHIESAATAMVAVLRPTKHFEIVTADNPDMVKTLALQQQFIAEALSAFPDLNPADKEIKTKALIKQFQTLLSQKAFAEQRQLIKQIMIAGIPIRIMIEDKGRLADGVVDYYTDQIFATDTGQYYDLGGTLHFIRAFFKNKQRKGEERLAVAQAKNLGAKVQTLLSKTGEKLIFEGGDIRQMISKKLFFIGQGHRSEHETGEAIAEASGYRVIPIVLCQEQFYHLDCCFLPLPNDAAVVYEGDYILDSAGQVQIDENGWPIIIPGTATMTSESRALLRTIYPPEKLVLISKEEALAYATNAVILQNPTTLQYKLFVNGPPSGFVEENEEGAIAKHQASFTKAHVEQIRQITEGMLEIIGTPYSTMHGSGGSIRCTVLELACQADAITPHRHRSYYFSDAIEKLEKALQTHSMFRQSKTALPDKPIASSSHTP